jgi:hypothetical protein
MQQQQQQTVPIWATACNYSGRKVPSYSMPVVNSRLAVSEQWGQSGPGQLHSSEIALDSYL